MYWGILAAVTIVTAWPTMHKQGVDAKHAVPCAHSDQEKEEGEQV